MKKSYLYGGLAASQCYLWRNSWFASWKFYNPSQVRQCPSLLSMKKNPFSAKNQAV